MWWQDPYRFIFTGILGVTVLVAAWFIFRKFRPNHKVNPLLVVTLLAILPVLSIFRPGTYQSGDLTHQAVFVGQFYDILKQGVLIPKWADRLNFNYGNPMFLFTYPLPYFIGAGFHALGFSFVDSVKAELVMTFVGSGIFMYLFARKLFSEKGAILAGIFYLYAPYHLIDMHYRVALGEMLALMWLPLVFLALNQNYIILSGLVIALTILSHQAIALIAFPILLIYAFVKRKNKFGWLVPFVLGILLSSWYWFPVMAETQYTHEPLYSQTVEFSPFWQTIYTPWQWGLLWQGHKAETANIVGYIQLFLVLALGWWLAVKKKFNYSWLAKLGLIFFVGYFFLEQQISWPIWKITPLIKNLQFAFRLNSILIMVTALMASIFYENQDIKQKGRWLLILGILAILPTLLNWGNRKMLPPYTDIEVEQGIPSNTLFNPYGPATPKWLDPDHPWQSKFPLAQLEVIAGQAQIDEISRSDTRHIYSVVVPVNTVMKENTIFFPGWTVYADNKKISLNELTYKTGIIHFELPTGAAKIEVKFEDTWDRKLGKILSSLTAGGIIIYLMGKLRSRGWRESGNQSG